MSCSFLRLACCPGSTDEIDDDHISINSDTPLLERPTPPPTPRLGPVMAPNKRTYGAKKTVVSAAAAAIFGAGAGAGSAGNIPSPSPAQGALTDITSVIGNLRLVDADEADEQEDPTLPHPPQHLAGLLASYQKDRGASLDSKSWQDLLSPGTIVEKIAEASYAEVYRVRAETEETSIVKIIRLKSPEDPASADLDIAIKISSVISELRIMNALTEIPSFVVFKEAHLIQGKSADQFKKAWIDYEQNSENGSEFPSPKQYTKDSLFLAIELGDAGTVLDEFKLRYIEEVWDILLGTVMALARAEMDCKFEHRDLHENNICILRPEGRPRSPTNHSHAERYGYSGLEISLIDFGLSRATLHDGDTVFYGLEEDLTVFQAPDGHPQFNAYKKMRTHLFTGARTMYKKAWHNEASKMLNNGHYWSEYTPYTNVIWIHYLINHLKKKFKADTNGQRQSELSLLEVDMREFTKRLDARTKIENGAFMSATECFTYAIEQGWYPEDMVNADQSAILDQSNITSPDAETGNDDDAKTFVTNEWIKEEASHCVDDDEDEDIETAVGSEDEAGEGEDGISQGGKARVFKGKHIKFDEDFKGKGEAIDNSDDSAESKDVKGKGKTPATREELQLEIEQAKVQLATTMSPIVKQMEQNLAEFRAKYANGVRSEPVSPTEPISTAPVDIPVAGPSSGRTTRAAARRVAEEESSGESNWKKLGRIRRERGLP